MATQETNRVGRGPGPLIREASLDQAGAGAAILAIALAISVVFNSALLVALRYLLPGPPSAVAMEAVPTAQEANVQAEPPPEPASTDPLTIEDVDPAAIAPDQEINYNVERKADVSVPGVVDPDAPIGIENAPETNPPMNIPLPFGTGGGTGGALTTDPTGTFKDIGSAGGYSLRGALQPGGFGGRSGATRKQLLEEGGGTGESEACVATGLNWLVRVQSPDGRWMLDGNFKNRGQANDIAGTAFGLLPFLGAGKTHKPGKDNPYDKPIERALLFLIRKQDRRTGNFGGGMYGHCLAAIAMSEAYGLTQDPFLRRPTQLAINYIVLAQHGEGGWRYSPGEKGDTSVTGWAVMALKSAKMAGLDVPEVTFRKGMRYLDGCCDPTNEGYGYTGLGSTPTMSAVGLLCRQYLQSWGSGNARMIKGVKNNLLTSPPPTAGTAPGSMYYY
jgi:hypothetical protein